MKGFLPFLAVFFAVVALDLLDQGRTTGAVFFAVLALVSTLITLIKKTKY